MVCLTKLVPSATGLEKRASRGGARPGLDEQAAGAAARGKTERAAGPTLGSGRYDGNPRATRASTARDGWWAATW